MAASEELTDLQEQLTEVNAAIRALVKSPKETTVADHRVMRRDLEELRCWRRSLVRRYNQQILRDNNIEPLFGRVVEITGSSLPGG